MSVDCRLEKVSPDLLINEVMKSCSINREVTLSFGLTWGGGRYFLKPRHINELNFIAMLDQEISLSLSLYAERHLLVLMGQTWTVLLS